MVKITRDKNKLTIEFDTHRGWVVNFSRTSEHEIDAILLKEHIEEVFSNRIEAIRRDAYEKGWKDKSSQKTKRTWFNRCINNDLRKK